MTKNKKKGKIRGVFKNITFQRTILVIITVIIAFFVIQNGAQPKKYKLNEGDVSVYDITSPRDIVNEVLTEKNRISAADSVEYVTKEDTKAFVDVVYKKDDFFKAVFEARSSVEKQMNQSGITSGSSSYKEYLAESVKTAVATLKTTIGELGVTLSDEQINYLVAKADENQLKTFEDLTRELLTQTMSGEVTDSNLAIHLHRLQSSYQSESGISQELKNIGNQLVKGILVPNRVIDEEATSKKREEAYNDDANVVKIKKGSRIISYGDIVTSDKLQLLEELNMLETKVKYDYVFSAGILFIILFLAVLASIFLYRYNRKVYNDRKELILLCLIILIILILARYLFPYYDGLAIPIFVGTMLVAILYNLELAVVINCALTIGISLMVKGDMKFLYLGLVCGVISALLVTKASQRSKLSINGIILGFINVLFIIGLNFINKSDWKTVLTDSIVVFLNGLVSMILTIGLLPFLENIFNIVTPLKLLELSDSNHPLLKKLLLEAPGTYHHSLMVGNLAEIATQDIGGNPMLSRAGAYFHDVGKLKRPDFFKENQLTGNPHDRMTPNLSALVITSHTKDGDEIAIKYKIPHVVRDIIKQHHGTTLVAYFYHKALKSEGEESVSQENYRYEGPKPQTREAAVVMLADSVEAAVRSMTEKTEGKIEALIRKIIKDKLDDGQLDMCKLTINDLDIITKAFMRVLSGYFHAREQYPEINQREKKDIPIQNNGEYNIEQQNESDRKEKEKNVDTI